MVRIVRPGSFNVPLTCENRQAIVAPTSVVDLRKGLK